MKNIENKEAVIKAARVAKQVPESNIFWIEVRKRMDARQKAMVKPREQ